MSPVPAQVEILGQPLTRIEYRGQQVVTFAMIDEVHGRPSGTAGRAFRDNKSRFEAQDFIELTSDEIRRMSKEGLLPQRTARAILITKRGYLKIAKTLGDDKAWDVFGEMLDRYFVVEEALTAIGINGQHELDLDPDDGMKAFRSEINRSGSLLSRGIDGAKMAILAYMSKHVLAGVGHVGDAVADLYRRTGKGLRTINDNVKAVHSQIDDLNKRLLPETGETPLIMSEWYACHRIYSDLCGAIDIPRQGALSANVSRSLDSFVLKSHRNSHMNVIDVAGRAVRIWHEQSVRPWFEQQGREMIASHVARYTHKAPLLTLINNSDWKGEDQP